MKEIKAIEIVRNLIIYLQFIGNEDEIEQKESENKSFLSALDKLEAKVVANKELEKLFLSRMTPDLRKIAKLLKNDSTTYDEWGDCTALGCHRKIDETEYCITFNGCYCSELRLKKDGHSWRVTCPDLDIEPFIVSQKNLDAFLDYLKNFAWVSWHEPDERDCYFMSKPERHAYLRAEVDRIKAHSQEQTA